MQNRIEPFFLGSLVCVGSFYIGASLIALVFRASVTVDGLFLLGLAFAGGVAGILVRKAYERGLAEGLEEGLARGLAEFGGESPGEHAAASTLSVGARPRRAAPVFVPPWGQQVPDAVSEAVVALIEAFWSRDHPEVA